MVINKPSSLAELDAMYAALRKELSAGPDVIEQANGASWDDEVVTKTSLTVPLYQNGNPLGVIQLSGDRQLGTRTAAKARLEAVQQRYAHVLASKPRQSNADCKRGTVDAGKCLAELVSILESMIRYPQFDARLNELPLEDTTQHERLLIVLCEFAGLVSNRLKDALKRRHGVAPKAAHALFTERELCRVLCETIRNELRFKQPTIRDEIAWLSSAEACQPSSGYADPEPDVPYRACNLFSRMREPGKGNSLV